MRHVELKRLDMVPYPLQGRHSCWLGERAGAEGDGHVFEQRRCGADAEVMAGQSEGTEIILWDLRQERVAGVFRPPELQEG